MALLDAKEYDPRPRQRLVRLILVAVVVVIVGVVAWFIFRYQPEKNVVDRFFTAIEAKNFEQAYGIYKADPDWKFHPDKYNTEYPYNQFLLDWGPSGDYGIITGHRIECATEPKKRGFRPPSGVIVVVRINNRSDRTESLWVEKKSKTINVSPDKVLCGGSTT
jgi:hypothetical protein